MGADAAVHEQPGAEMARPARLPTSTNAPARAAPELPIRERLGGHLQVAAARLAVRAAGRFGHDARMAQAALAREARPTQARPASLTGSARGISPAHPGAHSRALGDPGEVLVHPVADGREVGLDAAVAGRAGPGRRRQDLHVRRRQLQLLERA